jgi:hypothetical protein
LVYRLSYQMIQLIFLLRHLRRLKWMKPVAFIAIATAGAQFHKQSLIFHSSYKYAEKSVRLFTKVDITASLFPLNPITYSRSVLTSSITRLLIQHGGRTRI